MNAMTEENAITMKAHPLTVRETAKALNLSEPTVRAWLAQRRISFIQLGRAIRIPASEIDRLLSQGTVLAREAR
jgi:excisionase family DNA binding protein